VYAQLRVLYKFNKKKKRKKERKKKNDCLINLQAVNKPGVLFFIVILILFSPYFKF